MTAEPSSGNRNIWLILSRLALVILGIVFLVAAALKVLDPEGFASQIEGYGIISGFLALISAYFFIVVEFFLGLSLVLGVRLRLAVFGSVALLLFFIGITIWASFNGALEGCGCFGSLVDRTPGEVIVEDIVFLLLAIAGLPAARKPRESRSLTTLVSIATVAWAGFAIASPYLPLDGFVTDLEKGAPLPELSAVGAPDDLRTGRYLLAILKPGCPRCIEAAKILNQIAERDEFPEVIGLYSGTDEQRDDLRWKTGARFPLLFVDLQQLKRLHRGFPRAFVLESGVVRQIWNRRVPSPGELLDALDLTSSAGGPGGRPEESPHLFQKTSAYRLEIDGVMNESAIVYEWNEGSDLVLQTHSEESLLRLSLPAGDVLSYAQDRFESTAEGDLLMGTLGDGTVVGQTEFLEGALRFTLDGSDHVVRRSGPLLGELDIDRILSEIPEYRELADTYEPVPEALEALAQLEEPVQVEVYFGSWCPHCRNWVPRYIQTMRFAGNPMITSRFVGIPEDYQADPEIAQEKGILEIPAFLVFREGLEIGRIVYEPERSVEEDLVEILTGSK